MDGVTGELIGRDEALGRIEAFLADDVHFPAAALLVEGEAGVGKTVLWRRAVHDAEARGHTVLSCSPGSSEVQLSFAGLADLLGNVFPNLARELPEPQRHAIEAALLLSKPDRPLDRRLVAAALRSTIELLARRGPVLLAVDDLQWLDRSTASALQFAVRRLGSWPVALLLSRRSAGHEAWPLDLDRTLDPVRLERLRLGPLSLAAVHRLLQSRFGLTLGRPLLRRVHESTGGNPFYALEVGRALAAGEIQPRPGEPLPMPPSLDDLLRARLRRLPAATREALLIGAALPDPTVALVGEALELSAVEILEPAVDAQLIRVVAGRIEFSHPLVASVAWGAATGRRRRETHRRLAAIARSPEQRARHLALATEAANAEVARALDDAARLAAARGARESAAELLELAALRTPGSDRDALARRRIGAAEQSIAAGDPRRARESLESLVDDLPAGAMRASALLLLATTQEDDLRAGGDLAQRALAETGDDALLAASIHGYLAGTIALLGDLDTAVEHARAAVDAARRADDSGVLLHSLSHLRTLEMVLGRLEPEELDELVALETRLDAARGGSPAIYRSAATVIGRHLLYEDRLGEAREQLTAAYERSVERGDLFERPSILFYRAEAELLLGAWNEAECDAFEGEDIADQLGIAQTRLSLRSARASVAAHRGREREARQTAEAVLVEAAAVHDRTFSLRGHRTLGFLELSRGDASAALSHLGNFLGRHETPAYYRALPDAVEAAIGVGDLEQAEQGLRELADARQTPWTVATASRCRGLLLAARGEAEAGIGSLQDASDLLAKHSMPLEHARTLLCLGRTRRRAKQKRAARESLSEALVGFERLGAELWAEQARAELARVGGRTRALGLTDTERLVAELAARGDSNKEIAAALFVTVSAIEATLLRVYAKLEVRSRTQLAHRLATRDGDALHHATGKV